MKIEKITLRLWNVDVATLAKVEKLLESKGTIVVATADGDDPPTQDPDGGDPPK